MMTSRAQRITVVVVSINIDMADSDEDGGVGGFYCYVPGCYNSSTKDKSRLSFYVIPKGGKLRKLWLNKISRKGFNPKTSQLSGYRVCSEHFEGGCKTCGINVPTIFPLDKSHRT